jgi:hypothetical protein
METDMRLKDGFGFQLLGANVTLEFLYLHQPSLHFGRANALQLVLLHLLVEAKTLATLAALEFLRHIEILEVILQIWNST